MSYERCELNWAGREPRKPRYVIGRKRWKIFDKLDRKFFLDVYALIDCPFYSVSYVFTHDSLVQYSPRKQLKDTQ